MGGRRPLGGSVLVVEDGNSLVFPSIGLGRSFSGIAPLVGLVFGSFGDAFISDAVVLNGAASIRVFDPFRVHLLVLMLRMCLEWSRCFFEGFSKNILARYVFVGP